MARTARPQQREKDALEKHFAFVRTMTNANSSPLQKVIGGMQGLAPPLAMLLFSVAFFLRVQELDGAILLWVLGAGGVSLTGFAGGRMWLNRRGAARPGLQESNPETGGEGENSTTEDGENVPGDSVST